MPLGGIDIAKDHTYYVYAMLCQDGDGPGYIKFGRTINPHRRLTQLRSNCPIPARYFAIVESGNCHMQEHVEKSLHKQFADRCIRKGGRSEWFRFDFSSPEDKKAFNEGCSVVFWRNLRPGTWWTKISVKAIDAYNEKRRQAYLESKRRKRIDKRYRMERAQKRAWRELSY